MSQAWLGGCRRGAHISRGERLSRHRQAAGQVEPLHHHSVLLPLHPLVVPLHQGGVAHIHQLHGSLLHNSPVGQNALPDFPVVLQDEIPSGHCAIPPLLGTAVDVTEPDKDGLNQAATIWPLGKRGSGGECVPLHTLHPWSELLPLLRRPEPPGVQPALVSGSKHNPLLVIVQQVLPQSNNVANLSREQTQQHMRKQKHVQV